MDDLLEQTIAFRPILAKIGGSLATGILLSQLYYWSTVKQHEEFYKSNDDLMEECVLGRDAFYTAIKKITSLGIFTRVKKGLPAITHYRINLIKLAELIDNLSASNSTSISQDYATSSNADNINISNDTSGSTTSNAEICSTNVQGDFNIDTLILSDPNIITISNTDNNTSINTEAIATSNMESRSTNAQADRSIGTPAGRCTLYITEITTESISKERKKVNKKRDASIDANASSDCVSDKPDLTNTINQVISHWEKKTNKKLASDTGLYRNISCDIAKVLKTYSVDECKQVIDYVVGSPWHVQNGFTDLKSIFRPTKFAEKLAKVAQVYETADPNLISGYILAPGELMTQEQLMKRIEADVMAGRL